jgi:hypothetical protein
MEPPIHDTLFVDDVKARAFVENYNAKEKPVDTVSVSKHDTTNNNNND